MTMVGRVCKHLSACTQLTWCSSLGRLLRQSTKSLQMRPAATMPQRVGAMLSAQLRIGRFGLNQTSSTHTVFQSANRRATEQRPAEIIAEPQNVWKPNVASGHKAVSLLGLFWERGCSPLSPQRKGERAMTRRRYAKHTKSRCRYFTAAKGALAAPLFPWERRLLTNAFHRQGEPARDLHAASQR